MEALLKLENKLKYYFVVLEFATISRVPSFLKFIRRRRTQIIVNSDATIQYFSVSLLIKLCMQRSAALLKQLSKTDILVR